jgi:hypothetical protein
MHVERFVVTRIEPEEVVRMPVYCQSSGIWGYEEHQERASTVIKERGGGTNVICVLDAGSAGMYAQCSFVHKDMDGEYPLKFVDSMDSVVQQGVFDVLIPRYNVKRVFFLEESRFAEFSEHPRLGRYKRRFELVT